MSQNISHFSFSRFIGFAIHLGMNIYVRCIQKTMHLENLKWLITWNRYVVCAKKLCSDQLSLSSCTVVCNKNLKFKIVIIINDHKWTIVSSEAATRPGDIIWCRSHTSFISFLYFLTNMIFMHFHCKCTCGVGEESNSKRSSHLGITSSILDGVSLSKFLK